MLSALVVVPVIQRYQETIFSPPAWGDDRVQTLFIGSSHFSNGVAAALSSYGPETAVLHYPGMDATLALTAFEKHANRWPRLAVALVELDEFVLLTDAETLRHYDMSSFADRLWLNV